MNVVRGIRPGRPGEDAKKRGLNDSVWNLVENCWADDWSRRPHSLQIVKRLENAYRESTLQAMPASSSEAMVTDETRLNLDEFPTVFIDSVFVVEPNDVDLNSPNRRICFSTAPFSVAFLSRPAALQLTTLSKHQGWVDIRDQGSWSWYEIAIFPRSAINSDQADAFARLKRREDGSVLSWPSHWNPVECSNLEVSKGMSSIIITMCGGIYRRATP